MANRKASTLSRVRDDYCDGRVTIRLYPENAALFGDCLLFYAKHHPDHAKIGTLKEWAAVLRPRKKRRKS